MSIFSIAVHFEYIYYITCLCISACSHNVMFLPTTKLVHFSSLFNYMRNEIETKQSSLFERQRMLKGLKRIKVIHYIITMHKLTYVNICQTPGQAHSINTIKMDLKFVLHLYIY